MWEDEVLSRLKERDKIEKRDLEYFQAFDELRKRANAAELRLKALNDDQSSLGPHLSTELNQTEQKLIDANNTLTFANSQLKHEEKRLQNVEAKLKLQLQSSTRKLAAVKEEIAQKNRTIELINDELLSGQIQNNVLNEQIRELRKENDALVERWIIKAKEHADLLNEVNDLLVKERTGKTTPE